jgi:hypothetical protein
MAKGRFGGDTYKPQQLGPEPAVAAPQTPPPASEPVKVTAAPSASVPRADASAAALKAVKVPYSSRITYGADQQLKTMAKEGRSQTDLLSEALNLLFKEHGLDQIA